LPAGGLKLPRIVMNTSKAIRSVLSATVLAAGVYFGASAQFYEAALVSAFFAFALFSVCIIHLRLFPTLVDLAAILGGTALFLILDFRLLHYSPKLMAWFSFCGLSSFIVLALRLIWSPAEKRRYGVLAFLPSLLFVSSDWFASTFLEWTEKAHPKVLDLYLFNFDASLHVQLPFLLGQAFQTSHWFKTVSVLVYIALPIPIAVVYSGHLLRKESRAIAAMLAFLITGPVGIIFYNLFPAMGPAHIFRAEFPWHPFPLETVRRILLQPVAIPGPRNAIPSLHMGWVLLAWWFSRGLTAMERAIVAFFVVFTVCSTMGMGEHYFVDLVVAFPFALLIESICRYDFPLRGSRRISSAVIGVGMILAWFVALRLAPDFFLISPGIGWTACAATVIACGLQERALANSSVTAAPMPSVPVEIPASH
jgi:hypothetical protein